MLLEAPHMSQSKCVCVCVCTCACVHAYLILKQRKKPTLLAWGKNINKEPKQMQRIKVFFKLTIWLIAPEGTAKEEHNLLGFTVSAVPSPKVNLPVPVLHSVQCYCNNLDLGL